MRHLVLALSLLLTAATTARAEGWQTVSHLGYGVVDRSSTGFDAVAGSLVYFDAVHPVGSERVSLGLRSLAQGGRAQVGEFYRIGVGPLVSVTVAELWSVELGLQTFRETGLDDSGDEAYRSRGLALLVGWERRIPISDRVSATWGGFLCRHQGSMDHAASVSAGSRFADVDRNSGYTRGIALGLGVRL